MLAGAEPLLWAFADLRKKKKSAQSWKLLSACSGNEKCVCVSWT